MAQSKQNLINHAPRLPLITNTDQYPRTSRSSGTRKYHYNIHHVEHENIIINTQHVEHENIIINTHHVEHEIIIINTHQVEHENIITTYTMWNMKISL